jgi:hypothetical protein
MIVPNDEYWPYSLQLVKYQTTLQKENRQKGEGIQSMGSCLKAET